MFWLGLLKLFGLANWPCKRHDVYGHGSKANSCLLGMSQPPSCLVYFQVWNWVSTKVQSGYSRGFVKSFGQSEAFFSHVYTTACWFYAVFECLVGN